MPESELLVFSQDWPRSSSKPEFPTFIHDIAASTPFNADFFACDKGVCLWFTRIKATRGFCLFQRHTLLCACTWCFNSSLLLVNSSILLFLSSKSDDAWVSNSCILWHVSSVWTWGQKAERHEIMFLFKIFSKSCCDAHITCVKAMNTPV